jgi:uncharacterized protein (DUF342 family)
VTYAPDGSKAYLVVSDALADSYPPADVLLEFVSGHGILHGIDMATLEKMAADKSCNCKTEIAQASPPTPSTDGKIEILIDTSFRGKPRALSDGRVDHREMGYVVNVRKNAPILRRHPPVPGQDGVTVLGKPIPCSKPFDAMLSAGTGTRILEDDPDTLVADKDGAVAIFPDGRAEVLSEKMVKGDVDYTTGNITFAGNLLVRGTVRSGFLVEAEGNVLISGGVEDSQISAGADLQIGAGAAGAGHGMLQCGGALKTSHLENFTARISGNLDVAEGIVHCDIWADGTITAKSVVGGSVSAGKDVTIETIGTVAEPRTIVDLGGMAILEQQKHDVCKELAEVTAKTGQIKDAMYALVKQNLDAQGMLSEDLQTKLLVLKQYCGKHQEKSLEIQKQIDVLDEKLQGKTMPFLRAKTIFPNTLIKAGALEKLIKEKWFSAAITVENNEFTVIRF